MSKWKTELAELTVSFDKDNSELKKSRARVKKLEDMHRKVEKVLTPAPANGKKKK